MQTNIGAKYNLQSGESGAKIMYVDLKVMVDSYAIQNDMKELECM